MTAVPEGGPRPVGVVEACAVMMREQIAPALRELGVQGQLGDVHDARRRRSRPDQVPEGLTLGAQAGPALHRGSRLLVRADRIGSLLPVPALDTWWELTGSEPAGPVGETVIAVLRRHEWPAILAGLDDPAPQPHNDGMSCTPALCARDEPDSCGADPSASCLGPAGTTADGSAGRTGFVPSPAATRGRCRATAADQGKPSAWRAG
jgi:hypothetical protein